MAHYNNDEGNSENVPPLAPMTSSMLFDHFVQATTLKQVQSIFYQICITEGIDSTDFSTVYPQLRKIDQGKCNSKAEKLWALLDKRRAFFEYGRQKICKEMNVLIIGAGPCGLRAGIEAALLGAKVVIVEQRDKFSRHNVLHLWEFVIQDLKALGAKIFYPKFCTGSIEHISIRQLQCILTKVAFVLGVQIFDGISFSEILEPSSKSGNGWRAKFEPHHHLLSEFQFDVLIGADGKRNTLPGFPRQVVRGKLAIGITANFVNKKSPAEEKVQEISGVAYIFNQTFFKEMQEKTGINLENIVYYKDETHYFVMCAKKQSLLAKGVIKKDNEDIGILLSRENVDQEMLCKYAMQAADFATEGKLPALEYSSNHRGQCDVAMFDFTALYSALHSTHLIEREGKALIVSIVGDSLHEPFWPTGSGCARGFLGVFDAAWMLRSFGLNQLPAAEIIAERENVLKLLAQTTKEKMLKGVYSIDPKTRYQLLAKCDSDITRIRETQIDSLDSRFHFHTLPQWSNAVGNFDFDQKCGLLKFCLHALSSSKIKICNFKPSSWSDGRALAALISKLQPTLLNFVEFTQNSDSATMLNSVFSILEEEYGILKPSISIFMNEENEDSLIRYIQKVVSCLRKDAGYEARLVSATLRLPNRKRPKIFDASNVQKSEGIAKKANLLNALLNKDAGIFENIADSQTPSTSANKEERILTFLKSISQEENKESPDDGTLTRNYVPIPREDEKTITDFLKSMKEYSNAANSTLKKHKVKAAESSSDDKTLTRNYVPIPREDEKTIRDFLNSMNNSANPTLKKPKIPAASQKKKPSEHMHMIDESQLVPPIYPFLPVGREKIVIEKHKLDPPNPPPRNESTKQAAFDASKAVPPSPVTLRTPPVPPPRHTSIRNGIFEFPEPSAPDYDALYAPPIPMARHTSLSEASKYSIIKDPWIESTPIPEAVIENSENPTENSVNLLTKPTKVAERVYFTAPKIYRSNTMKNPKSQLAQLQTLMSKSGFSTLPSNIGKQGENGISMEVLRKFFTEDLTSSDDETSSDSDDYELSTLCTDSDAESFSYHDNISSEPSSLHTDSEDSDAEVNESTLKRNTVILANNQKSEAEILKDENDYIEFLQSLPKQ